MPIMTIKAFYSVVVLNPDIFETTIADERHFGSRSEAEDFAGRCIAKGFTPVILSL